MKHYAQITNGVVVNIIESDTDPDGINGGWIECGPVGPGYTYVDGVFSAPVVVTEPPPIWEWFIDHGPWADRLGLAAMAIDISTIPELVAIRADTARRKWVDLKDIRTVGAVWFLAGVAHPVLGTLATPLLTAEEATLVLNTKPTDEDNLALRKVYFS